MRLAATSNFTSIRKHSRRPKRGFPFKKIVRQRAKRERETVSLRDELCKIGLGYVDLETGGTELKVTCQITKTG